MFLFISGQYTLNRHIQETWEKQKAKTREIMVRDIMRSIEIERKKMKEDDMIMPFGFEDLVNSAKKTIWVGEAELRGMCAEALWRLLPPEDYRSDDFKLYKEDIFK